MDFELYNHLKTEYNNNTDLKILEITGAPNERLQKIRKLVANCEGSTKNSYPLLSAATLDLDRKQGKRIHIDLLAEAYLKNANKHWLSPMDRLNKLQGNLTKYLGPSTTLYPFILLLSYLASQGISPHAFLTYIIIPRMENDFNWRKWKEHIKPLEVIAKILIDLKAKPPFNKSIIGSAGLKLVRDIILVKYVGRPLAQYGKTILANEEFIEHYKNIWQNFTLEDAYSIYFIRRNLLNLIYKLSGRLDVQQLIKLLEQIPNIESAFRDSYSEVIRTDNKSRTQYQKIHLYDADINISLRDRRVKGFTDFDLAVEANAYINLMTQLSKTNSGIYLSTYFAGILAARKDPVAASSLAHLVSILKDDEGMYIYIWHANNMLKAKAEDYSRFIRQVEYNRGVHPSYPDLNNIFSDNFSSEELDELIELANQLGIEITPGEPITFVLLLNRYLKNEPRINSIYEKFRTDLINGQDRSWDTKILNRIDSVFNEKLHKALLKSVIKGIGTGYARGIKSNSLKGLYSDYKQLNSLPFPEVYHNFHLAETKELSTNSLKDSELSKKINYKTIAKIWYCLFPKNEGKDLQAIVQKLNKMTIGKQKALLNKREALISLRKTLTKTVKTPKVLKKWKKDKQIYLNIQKDIQSFRMIMDNFNDMTDHEKFLTTIIICGYYAYKDSEWSRLALKQLINRYSTDRVIRKRLQILKKDIIIENITFQQLEYILNTLHSLKYKLLNDETLISDMERNKLLLELTRPFFLVNEKRISHNVLDAAFHRITYLLKVQQELNKWRQIEEEISDESSRYFRDMSLFTSKSFIDSYYGDMGGICLSMNPDKMKHRGLINIRLVDNTKKCITGMALLAYNNTPCQELGLKSYWFAFAINPLHSLLSKLGENQQLELYLQFRKLFKMVANKTGYAVLLPGLSTWGVISNDMAFTSIIQDYESSQGKPGLITNNAKGFSLYYSEKDFSHARVICTPEKMITV